MTSTASPQINIRVANLEEVEEFAKWGNEEGWNMSTVDLKSYFELFPSGWIVAEMNGIPIGRLYCTRYPSCDHIGVLIVAKNYRGRGIGKQLLNYVFKVSLKGCSIVALYSGREEIPFYINLGFSVRESVLRFSFTNKELDMTTVNDIQVDDGSNDEIVAYDAELSGSFRPGFWKLFGDGQPLPKSYCAWVKCPKTKKIIGVGAIHKVTKSTRLGPLYAKDIHVGAEILKKLLTQVSTNSIVSCDVFKDNVNWVELLKSLGFIFKGDCVLLVKSSEENEKHPSSVHREQILCIKSLDFN